MGKRKALFEKLDEVLSEYRPKPHWDTTQSAMGLLTENYALMAAFYTALEKAGLSQDFIDILYDRESLLDDMVIYWRAQESAAMDEPYIEQLTDAFLAEAWREHRHELLCDRISSEYEVFREGLLTLPKEGIIDKAFQIAAKEDIQMLIDTHHFELPDIETLLALEHPLDEIYLEWLDFDGSGMDDLFTCVDRVIHDTRERQAQDGPTEAPVQSEAKSWANMNTQEWTFDKHIENEHVLAILEGPQEADFATLDQAYEVLKSYAFTDPIDREILMTYDRPLETVALKMELEMTDAEGGISLAIKERRDNLQFFHDHFGQLPNFMQKALRQFEGHCAHVIGQPIRELSDYDNWSFRMDDINEQEVDDELEQ